MLRCLAVLTALTVIISFASCADRSAAIHPKPLDDVSFSCVIFNGPSSELKFDGHISSQTFTKWFQEDYGVGGERIETPPAATAVGALVLIHDNNPFAMPICTWTIESGHKYFACQSDSIGSAPMLSVCVESKTVDEFLEQLKRKLSELAEIAG